MDEDDTWGALTCPTIVGHETYVDKIWRIDDFIDDSSTFFAGKYIFTGNILKPCREFFPDQEEEVYVIKYTLYIEPLNHKRTLYTVILATNMLDYVYDLIVLYRKYHYLMNDHIPYVLFNDKTKEEKVLFFKEENGMLHLK